MIIDRNLLFAVVALQADFLDQQQFLEICRSWASHKQTPIGDMLEQCGWLSPTDRAAVDRLVARKLGKSQSDERTVLLALTDESVRQSLLGLNDAGITHVLSAKPSPPPRAAVHSPVRAPQPQFGKRERYSLTRLHASGGLGHVWLAHDPELERDVALKEIRPEHTDSENTRTRFVGEARITGRLEHPGVVPVYELNKDSSGRPFYTMRFIQGRTFTSAIEEYHQLLLTKGSAGGQTQMIFRELLQRFISVCQTIGYVHNKGIIHRDLKPDNVMLGEYGETLIVDWGLAKPFHRATTSEAVPADALLHAPASPTGGAGSANASAALTQEGNIIGTPMYMAPEQTIGDPTMLGPWTDIHSLGILLYIVLTGKAPFDGDIVKVMLQIRKQPPVPPSQHHRSVPRALEAICLKALAKSPADRYASAADMAAEIQRWLADEPVLAYPEPMSVRLRRWTKRHRALVTGAAAAVVVGLIVLLFATVFLTAANQRERAAKQEAEDQRDRADKNLDLARKAVDDTLAHIAALPRLRQPDLLSLRRDLLTQVVPFYKQFVEQRADDPRVEAERGNAYGQLALVHHELGQTDLAINELQQKLAIYRALTVRYPQEVKYRQEQAAALNNLSILLRTVGRPDEARNSLTESIQLQQGLPRQARSPDLMAICHVSLGNLLHESGDVNGAITALETARRLFQELTTAAPRNVKFRQGLAACEDNLGNLLSQQDRYAEADEVLQHAVQLREGLADEHPEPSTRLELARIYNNLADHWSKQESQQQKAGEYYHKAVVLIEPMTRTPPVLPEYRLELAKARINLGKLLAQLGQLVEAEASLKQAIEHLEKLRQEFPRVLPYAMGLGGAYSHLGDVFQATQQHEAALREYGKAITVLQAYPQQTQARLILRITFGKQAEALTQLGRHTEALAEWDRALALSSGDEELFRVQRAASVARGGNIPDALASVERLETASTTGPFLFAFARLHALAAAGHPDATQRPTHASRTLELLKQAQTAGVFKERKHRVTLQKDKDFDAVRSRPEFQELLKGVTKD